MQLNLLVKPVAEVLIGGNVIYLYPVSLGDVNDFAGCDEGVDVTEKFRMFLTLVASLSIPTDYREGREALAGELIEQMSIEELELLASVYIGISSFDKVRAGNPVEYISPVTRNVTETAISFLDRLLLAEAERQRRIFDQINA